MENLLPTDLEAISPYSDMQDDEFDGVNENEKATNNSSEIMQEDLNNSKIDEDESPPFEPLEESVTLMAPEENSIDSHLSGISGLASHDSNHSQEQKVDICSQDSQTSKHSSEEQMCFSPSDDNDTKMEVCEDSRYSKSSKSRDSNSKFEFSQDSQSNSDKSLMAEKKQDVKKEYKSRDRYKSSKSDKKDSKDRSKDRKSESRDKKDRHSSSKDSKSSKDRKDSRSEKEKSKSKDSASRNSSGSRDKNSSGSKKESHSKDKSLDVKEKSKTSKEHDKDSKSKEKTDTKSSSRHTSDKHKRDDRRKHSSSSHQKHKKDEKKENKKDPKDDHFSSKQGKHGRRSTDRDSNDGRSNQKSASNFTLDSASSAESQKQEQESSGSNSGSVDSGNSETDAVENVNQSTDFQRVKIIKPKFASNIHEARRLMKIRKELNKIEKRNQLSLDLATNNSLLLISKLKTGSNGLLDAMNLEDVDVTARESWALEEKSQETLSPPLVNSVIMKDSWDALEAKLSAQVMNDGYDDRGEYSEDESNEKDVNVEARFGEKQDKIKIEKTQENNCNVKTYQSDCICFEKSITPEIQRYFKYANSEIQRLESSIECMSSEKLHSSPLPLLETSPRENSKRKRNSDVKNNNKKLFNNKHLTENEHMVNCGKVKKTRKSTGVVTAFNDNFSLPLSPAESEKSVDRKVEFNEKIKKNTMSLKGWFIC